MQTELLIIPKISLEKRQDVYKRQVADQRHTRLSVVFGCGGDREADKRPLMGRIACTYADQVVLCDDNPRTEDPDRILAQIAAGCDGSEKIIRDRAEAIKFVLDGAQTDENKAEAATTSSGSNKNAMRKNTHPRKVTGNLLQ